MKSAAPFGSSGYRTVADPLLGGFSKVYRATHPAHPGKQFAIKVPREPDRQEVVARFMREAKVLANVEHPNLIRLVESRLDANPPFLVFDYFEEGSLRKLVGRASLEFSLIALRDLATCLDAIHSTGGFHRDVKPDNALVRAGRIILSDLNLANIPTKGSAFTTEVYGTPGYIDPHAVNHQYSPPSDIWSLGVTFGELLTGCPPRRIADASGLALRTAELSTAGGIRDSIEQLLRAMLSPVRETRPAARTVAAQAEALLDRVTAAKKSVALPQLDARTLVGLAAVGLLIMAAVGCSRR